MPMPRTILATGRALCGALLIGLGVLAALDPVQAQVQAEHHGDFGRFVEGLWPEARARGVSRSTFNEAFRDVAPDPKIIALTKK
jgi:peptidoglycan lytic transglycosylase B